MELMRIPNSVLSGFGALFSVLVYSNYCAEALTLIVAYVTGFTVTAASMIVNDIVDLKVDTVNKPWKPLPRGEASVEKSRVLAVALVALAIIVNAFHSAQTLLVTIIYSAIGLTYSYLRNKVWSHLLVAASTTGPIIYGYIAAGAPVENLCFTAIFTSTIFTVTLGREFLKAIQDHEGDRRHGYRTIATTLGVEKAAKTMLATGLTGSAMGALTTLTETSTAYKALITLAAAIYAYSVHKAYRERNNEKTLEKARRNTLIAMYTGIVAFWLSRI